MNETSRRPSLGGPGATILGMTRRQVSAKFDDLIDFPALEEEFIETSARFAFPIAIYFNRHVLYQRASGLFMGTGYLPIERSLTLLRSVLAMENFSLNRGEAFMCTIKLILK